MPSQLTELIRKKYPGQYDDLDDDTLEKSVLAKHPEYKDLAAPLESKIEESKIEPDIVTPKKLSFSDVVSASSTDSPKEHSPLERVILGEKQKEEEPNTLEKLYRGVFEAPEFITKPAHELAAKIDEPSLSSSPTGEGGFNDYLAGVKARGKGFLAGATEGVASLASPANILTLGRGKIGQVAARIFGGGQVAHGISELTKGNYASGLGDIGFGALGLASPHANVEEPHIARGNLGRIAESVAGREAPRDIPLAPIEKPVTSIKPTEVKPIAEFLGLQQDGKPLFNISGGPNNKSTVGLDKLKELGIEAPEIPANAVPMRGEDLRAAALSARNKKFDPGSLGFGEKPKAPDEISDLIKSAGLEEPPSIEVVGQDASKPDNLAEMQQRRSTAMDARNKGFRNTANDISSGETRGFATQGNEPTPGLDPRTKALLDKNNQIAKMANETQKKGLWPEIRDANRAILTSFDFSAAGRQGKPLMLTKAYWNSFDDMFKSWGSERAYNNVMDSINEHPNFKAQEINGKPIKSLADRAGLSIGNAEQFQSNIAEKFIPGVRPSERAYNAFLNKLRADHFNTMVKDSIDAGIDVTKSDVELKKIGSFINDATGRGSLGRLEKAAPILNEAFFAPHLIASRVNMYKRWLDPRTYASANPVIRKQALKSLLATVGFGTAVGELARLAGAQVSNDPNSSDFRKVKIGNVRIDPFSGFQQYAVGAHRLLSGKSTSSTTGKVTDLTAGKYGKPTRASVTSQFFQNKLAPIPSLVWSWMEGKDWNGQPFDAKKALLDRTVPIVMQDLTDLAKENPKLLPLGVLPIMGEGLQTYGR